MAPELSLVALLQKFPAAATAEAWFIDQRWPDGVRCPACHSAPIQARPTSHPPPFRCRTCRKDFSVRTDPLLHGSTLSLQTWAWASSRLAPHPKGISSLQLSKLLGLTQKTAWSLAHRMRETWRDDVVQCAGPVEVAEPFVGGLEKTKNGKKKLHAGTGGTGKSIVVGCKDRATHPVQAAVVVHRDRATVPQFITARVQPSARVYTDEYTGYDGVAHRAFLSPGAQPSVDGAGPTTGIESVWAVLQRAHTGVSPQMRPKPLPRSVPECVGRQNQRALPPLARMEQLAGRMAVKRLRSGELIGREGEGMQPRRQGQRLAIGKHDGEIAPLKGGPLRRQSGERRHHPPRWLPAMRA